MSAEHVDAMNALLVDHPDVRAACAALDRPYAVVSRLRKGPDLVHWTITYEDTVQFSLEPHPQPDVVLVGEWKDMVAASAAGRRGEPYQADLAYEGDPQVLAAVAPALEAARAIATVDVDFPDV